MSSRNLGLGSIVIGKILSCRSLEKVTVFLTGIDAFY